MSLVRIGLLALALCCAPMASPLCAPAPAAAGAENAKPEEPGRARKASPRKASPRKARARKARARKARARKARARKVRARKARARGKRQANRPAGWQWPPSDAMLAQGEVCLEALSARGVEWKKAPRHKGIATPIRVPSLRFDAIELGPTFRKPPFVMDCHLALALAKASSSLQEMGIAELRFSSIYSYRRAIVDGKEKNSLSRHSYGLAVDVYELRDREGETFIVEEDYFESEWLRRAEESINESAQFRLVLSPANDPRSHSDHFHLEAKVAYPQAPRASGKTPRKRRKRVRKGAQAKAP